MSNGSGWSPGKIFLVIVCVVLGLGILCCGGVFLMYGDKIKSGFSFATEMGEFSIRLQNELGKGSMVTFQQNDKLEWIMVVGLPGELTEERVREAQDKAWKAASEIFAKDGFLPVKEVAVGTPVKPSPGSTGGVSGWAKNSVRIDELVQRTGCPAPPVMKLIPNEVGGARLDIKAESDDEKTPEEKSGGGSGGK